MLLFSVSCSCELLHVDSGISELPEHIRSQVQRNLLISNAAHLEIGISHDYSDSGFLLGHPAHSIHSILNATIIIQTSDPVSASDVFVSEHLRLITFCQFIQLYLFQSDRLLSARFDI